MKKFYLTALSVITSDKLSFLYRLFLNRSALFLFNKVIIVTIFAFFFTNNALADYTIPSGTTVDASTITAAQQTGILYIYGTLIVSTNVSLSGFTGVEINGPGGSIFWSKNTNLFFNSGISFDIINPGTTGGLQPTGGNAAMSLTIGSVTIAVSNDNSNNAAFSFAQFNAAGGLPKFTLTSSPTSPATICYGASFSATVTPLDLNTTYDCYWTASPSTGTSFTPAPTPAGSPNFSNFNTPQTVIFNYPNVSQTYILSCELTRHGDKDPITTMTVSVKVNPLPTTVIVSGGGAHLCTTSTTLTATGGTGGTIYYEGNLANGTLTSTASSSQLINNSGTYYFRALTAAGCWGTQGSAVVAFHNLWTGTGTPGIDWNTPSNWSDNQLPSTTCPDVYIPSTLNQPTLSNSPIATINNLHILSGATLTVNGIGTLQIAGTISNSGIFDVSNGTLELNGTSTQTIDGSVLRNRNLKNLTISNNVNVSNTLNDTLNILGTLAFGTSTTILNTNDNLTLKSSDTATANIGIMATGNVINGNVTVERYIGTGTYHAKSWQLLAIPTSSAQTIKQAWQEGATATNISLHTGGSLGNPNSGYGTMLTSNVANAATQLSPGFDAYTSPGPSIKVYNSVTDGYDGPATTGIPIYNQKGYFVLVRGDRSVYTSSGLATPTILRTKGTLFTPANPPPSSSVGLNQFTSVGNPYASPLDLRNLSYGSGISTTVIVWDPTITTGTSAYGLGAFQYLFTIDGVSYLNLLTSAYYGPALSSNNYIQSGQAFIIQDNGGGTLTFKETDKANTSGPLVTTPSPINQSQGMLRTNLNVVNTDGSTTLIDGALDMFNDTYSNAVDGMDARKVFNTGENLGIKTGGKLLAIERRQNLTAEDTIFLNLSNVRVQAYQFSFDAQNINTGIEAFLVDSYLNTSTPISLSGTTLVNFNIANIPGSYAANRFMIVFAPPAALPVTFTSVKAYQQGSNINVEWKVDNETNMKQYVVEKSMDGNIFSAMAVTPTKANNGSSAGYQAIDTHPVDEYNYYRIKSVDINKTIACTNIVKVLMGTLKQDISIYPNPITDGTIHLQLVNQQEGNYGIRLLNKLGKVIINKQINHSQGSSTELIKWNYNLAHGMYQIEVTKPDGSINDINVIY